MPRRMVRVFAVALVAAAAPPAARARECRIEGQSLVVAGLDGGLKIALCRRKTLFGVVAEGGYGKEVLASFLDHVEGDEKSLQALRALEIGPNMEAMRRNAAKVEKPVNITGDQSDRAHLEHLAGKLNEMAGIPQQLAALDAREQEDRAVGADESLTAARLAELVAANASLLAVIESKGCEVVDADFHRQLQCVQMTFGDGESQSYCPFKAEAAGPDSQAVSALGPSRRVISFRGDQAFYAGKDGKDYEIVKINKVSAAAGLGPTRPFGWSDSGKSESCLLSGKTAGKEN